jgi:hypothetical protein
LVFEKKVISREFENQFLAFKKSWVSIEIRSLSKSLTFYSISPFKINGKNIKKLIN